MKIQITLITLIGLTCVTIGLGKEIQSNLGSQIDTRSFAERANQMIREPSMNQLMAQIDNMQKQMTALHETLRRNHTRRNTYSMRNIADAFAELNRNFNAINSQFSRYLSSGAIPSTLGTRSKESDQLQSPLSSAISSSASSSSTISQS